MNIEHPAQPIQIPRVRQRLLARHRRAMSGALFGAVAAAVALDPYESTEEEVESALGDLSEAVVDILKEYRRLMRAHT